MARKPSASLQTAGNSRPVAPLVMRSMPRSRDLGRRESDGRSTRSAEDPETITFALRGEPSSLDPTLGRDTVSAQVTMSIMDPLVVLRGKPLKPVPNPACTSSWLETYIDRADEAEAVKAIQAALAQKSV